MTPPHPSPSEVLALALKRAGLAHDTTLVTDPAAQARVAFVARAQITTVARMLMACLLAKIDRPEVDVRKPYTAIGGDDSFSGRSYDENFVTSFIHSNRLPLITTSGFLSPAARDNKPLTLDLKMRGKQPELYRNLLLLLDDVAQQRVLAPDLLAELIRWLIKRRDEEAAALKVLLRSQQCQATQLPLSSEAIVRLLTQHLQSKHASRLPVLIVAAAYECAAERLGERARPLEAHNAADAATGSTGDVEVCLVGDDLTVTTYEMKMKRVTRDDIDSALVKIADRQPRIHNYIFITTERIERDIAEYADKAYELTGGTEVAVLDCVGFLRHFLHLFHRLRQAFLDSYQRLLLDEPSAAVSPALKQAFLALRIAAEAEAPEEEDGTAGTN